jgi:S-adenosylmethionine decarboxylase
MPRYNYLETTNIMNNTDQNNNIHAGKHLLIDLYGCEISDTPESLREKLEAVCKDIGATVLYSYAHEFNNGGSSGVVILAESHLSWHHWIDEKFIAVDIFVCGICDPRNAIQHIKTIFKPTETKTHLHHRGTNYSEPC